MTKFITIPSACDITYDFQYYLKEQGFDLSGSEIQDCLIDLKNLLAQQNYDLYDKLETKGPFLMEWCHQKELDYIESDKQIRKLFPHILEDAE
jgi:hypothetical protein